MSSAPMRTMPGTGFSPMAAAWRRSGLSGDRHHLLCEPRNIYARRFEPAGIYSSILIFPKSYALAHDVKGKCEPKLFSDCSWLLRPFRRRRLKCFMRAFARFAQGSNSPAAILIRTISSHFPFELLQSLVHHCENSIHYRDIREIEPQLCKEQLGRLVRKTRLHQTDELIGKTAIVLQS